MKYTYTRDDSIHDDSARVSLAALAKKDEGTKKPIHTFDSHDALMMALEDACKGHSGIDQRVLNMIELYDRTNFFDWESVPEPIRKQLGTPYCFMALVFAEGQTIPSPHFVLASLSSLDLRDGQKILEIGAGSGYHITIAALVAGQHTRAYSTEVRPSLTKLARETIATLALDDRVRVIQAEELGLPSEAPFDRIYTTVSARTTDQVETLLDQLHVGGLLRLPIAKYGNVKDKSQSRLWEPGMDIDHSDIYVNDPSRGFVRVASFLFRKNSETEVTYANTVKGALGPLLVE
jgi:protein-L-isoaspartate(D-aspartate) O-methyltransferase